MKAREFIKAIRQGYAPTPPKYQPLLNQPTSPHYLREIAPCSVCGTTLIRLTRDKRVLVSCDCEEKF